MFVVTAKNATEVYKLFTGRDLTFMELWKLMYFREFPQSGRHWVSPPRGDDMPTWFFEHLEDACYAAQPGDETPVVKIPAALPSTDDRFDVVESLAVANLQDEDADFAKALRKIGSPG